MSMFNFDRSSDQIGVVLVHGYVNGDVLPRLEVVMGSPVYLQEVYHDGGYTTTLVTTREIDYFTAANWTSTIYDHEDDIPDMNPDEPDYPVFVGIQDTPYELASEDDEVFQFVGGIWGHEEDDSTRLYQE